MLLDWLHGEYLQHDEIIRQMGDGKRDRWPPTGLNRDSERIPRRLRRG